MLTCLTLLAIFAQLSFYFTHYRVSDLMDSLVKVSLLSQLKHTVIIKPIVVFLLIQITSYILFIGWIWFISTSTGELLNLSERKIYWLGILSWLCSCIFVVCFNNFYFTHSFFSILLQNMHIIPTTYNNNILILSATLLSISSILAFINFIKCKRHIILGSVFSILILLSFGIPTYNYFFGYTKKSNASTQPNIIFIGVDSVRPDFTHYFNNPTIHTPNIDSFLNSATVFTQAYSPLARTFPAWMTILTGKYPKHSKARNNLVNPELIIPNDNLAKKLQAAGYETIYGTDEKRFSNIIPPYGFDHIIGPEIGINDFILGGLADFPLSNLLINTPLGEFLFPFNYANRAAAITYTPNTFLNLVQQALAKKMDKPVFLAIHLCLSHWPYTWAHDKQSPHDTEAMRYASSVEGVDHQFGELLALLDKDDLLKNSIIVLLSDHGTTVGIPNDRMISPQNYRGDKDKYHWITAFALDTPNHYQLSINTSYGQGSDILSIKQNHTLLAIHNTDNSMPHQEINTPVALFDLAPTILDVLHVKPLTNIDGVSLMPLITHQNTASWQRSFFFETGYTITEIETNSIEVNKVIQQSAAAYVIQPHTGFLYMKPEVETSIIKNKQRSILMGDWYLAHYPASTRAKLQFDKKNNGTLTGYTLPGYYVLVNVKTGLWTIGLNNTFAKQAPVTEMLKVFNTFYRNEI